MTVVVADSSPLNYLVLTGSIDILRELFNRILVPDEVIVELCAAGAPSEVRQWVGALPEWVLVSSSGRVADREMPHLDPGERAAIMLAQSHPEALLLIDDAEGRLEATRRGIKCTGTLGVLRAAASKNLVDLPSMLGRLLETNFRISPSIVSDLLSEDAKRRNAD
jgi:predicted nucleic acid-binding protein